MAIGSKGEDHDFIEKFFTEELKELSSVGGYFFYAALSRIVRVKAGILIACVDRPERTKMFYCGDHNSSFPVCRGGGRRSDRRYVQI
jgi:hypothetical protein